MKREASPATTPAALILFAFKGKYKKIWPTKSDRCPFFTTVDGSNALLYEPMVSFSAKFYYLAADKIATFCYTNSVCPSVRLSATSRSTAKTVRGRPMVTIKSLQEVATGLLIVNPTRPPLPQTVGSQPVKTCIANCSQAVPDTTMFCTDSLWDGNISPPYP